jgi:hypothetical protein
MLASVEASARKDPIGKFTPHQYAMYDGGAKITRQIGPPARAVGRQTLSEPVSQKQQQEGFSLLVTQSQPVAATCQSI